MSEDRNKSGNNKSEDIQFAIIGDDGKEIPVTKKMIEASFAKAKPDSIGKHTLPETPVITDEMITLAKNKP
jgi:hypothetical protein